MPALLPRNTSHNTPRNTLLRTSLRRLARIATLGLLIAASLSCRKALKPPPELCLIEEAQGQYSYQDAEDSYSGRFILFSCEDRLAIDLFAFYFPAASIRHNKDSTLLYLPINNEVLILGPNERLPLQGWELPIAPLAAAYQGKIPDEPDSVTESEDTLITWEQGTAYLQVADNSEVIALRGEGWELRREGLIEGAPDRARRIVLKQEDAELILEFADIKFVEKEPAKVFPLHLSDGVKRLDYR